LGDQRFSAQNARLSKDVGGAQIMTTVRERHSALLAQASERLAVLNNRSTMPDKLLEEALANLNTVFEESASAGHKYIVPELKRTIRVSIVSLKGMLNIARDVGADFKPSDLEKIRTTASMLRHVAAGVLNDPRLPKNKEEEGTSPERPTYSAIGLRMKTFRDLAGAKPYVVAAHDLHARKAEVATPIEDETPEMPKALVDATKAVGKLPARVPAGQPYASATMPVLAFPHGNINQSALNREGIEYTRIRGLTVPKDHIVSGLPAISDAGYLLLPDQTVFGFPEKSLTNALVKSLISTISKRKGPHVNPIGNKTADQSIQSQTIRAPHSHLSWLWLVPSRWVSSGAVNVVAATFPTLTSEPDHVRESREKDERKELQNLESIEEHTKKLKRKMDEKDEKRLAELREKKSVPKPKVETVQDKTARLAKLKAELEKQVRQQFAKQFADIEVLNESLKDLGDPKDDSPMKKQQRIGIRQQIRKIEAVIEKGREILQTKIRNRP
jgi:hypothetical protein